MTTLEKTLLWIARIGVFALPFICLVVATPLFFPFITGKNFLFRIIVEIMSGSWLTLALINPNYRPRKSWILAAFAIFVAVIAVADAQGVNPFKSFLSNFERMDGWITIAHLLAYVLVAAAVMNTERIWRWLFKISLAVSVFATLDGFLQIIGVTALGEGGTAGLTSRIDATFGNPIYLAVYMLFHIFIAAMLWSQMWVTRKSGKRLWPSVAYGTVIVLDTIALLFTGTRGTTFGLIGGVLITAALMLLLARNSRNAWRGSVVAICAVLIMCGSFFLVRDAAWIQHIGFLQRLATVSTNDNTVKARFINWEVAWKGVQERPVLGWGQENFAIVFDKYYDPRMYAQEQWFDRVHNIVFDWLVAGGFLGLLAYLSIFVATLWVLWRSGVFTIAERSILTGLLAGYFCHNFFVFDNVTSYILFGTILSYIVWREAETNKTKTIFASVELPSFTPVVATVGLFVVTAGAVWMINVPALQANIAILHGLETGNPNDFATAITYKTLGTQEAREQLVQTASQLATNNQVSVAIKQQILNAALNQMVEQAKESPLDARFPLFIGVTEDAYSDYQDAAISLQKAHELSPNKQSIIYEQGFNAQARKDYTGALAFFKSAYDLATDNTQAQVYYAAAAILAGNQKLADQLLAPLIPTGDAADPHIASAYAGTKQYAQIITIWRAYIAAHPTGDPQAYFTLAAALYDNGQSKEAIKVLEESTVVMPQTANQASLFITQIANGTAKIQ